MKQTIMTVAVLAIMVTVVSCEKEIIVSDDAKGMVFTATIDEEMDTKTTLSGSQVNWKDNDSITINGVKYIATPKSDKSKAYFAKKNTSDLDPTGTTYYAFYPAGIQCTNDYTKGVLKSTQTYNDSADGFSDVPMYATGTTTTLSFYNICAVLAITVNGVQTVKSIEVTSTGNAICGEFTVNSENKAVLSSSSANTVTLTYNTSIYIESGGSKTFYIAIPAQSYENFTIKLSDGSSTLSMATKKSSIEVNVNTIYSITFKADSR